jgi:hypothetical protein
MALLLRLTGVVRVAIIASAGDVVVSYRSALSGPDRGPIVTAGGNGL